jgi:hypothetical protein
MDSCAQTLHFWAQHTSMIDLKTVYSYGNDDTCFFFQATQATLKEEVARYALL